MRTSKISQETTRLLTALSTSGRTTRSKRKSAGTRSALNGSAASDGVADVKERGDDDQASDMKGYVNGVTAAGTPDIEDTFTSSRTSSRSSRKRKHGEETTTATASSSATTVKTTGTKTEETWTPTPRRSARKHNSTSAALKKDEDNDKDDLPTQDGSEDAALASAPSNSKPRRQAARKVTAPSGAVTIHPPSNWELTYSLIRQQRLSNPTAPVDTMGCEDLYWPASPPKEQRYHTLCSLMLSSQTKDTVTAAAMSRLHTELVPHADAKQSVLTVENMLKVSPAHLDSLIGKVGFHNNKTRYLRSVAEILHATYSSDIPSTLEGLLSLPGVGPKMAYLCLSAAWSVDLGIGVDVHVHRITNLWGWHKTKTPEETRAQLESWLPRDKWHEINKMLVGLGQTVCLPVGRRCWDCGLQGKGLCPGEIKGVKVLEEKRIAEVKKRGGGVAKKEEEDRAVVKNEETRVVPSIEEDDQVVKKEEDRPIVKKEEEDQVVAKKEEEDGVMVKREENSVIVKKEQQGGVVLKKEEEEEDHKGVVKKEEKEEHGGVVKKEEEVKGAIKKEEDRVILKKEEEDRVVLKEEDRVILKEEDRVILKEEDRVVLKKEEEDILMVKEELAGGYVGW